MKTNKVFLYFGFQYMLALLFMPLIVLASPDEKVHVDVLIPTGKIGFSIGFDWKLVAMQNMQPEAPTTFKIAEDTTPNSSQLSFSIFNATSPEMKDAEFSRFGSVVSGKVETRKRGDWNVLSYQSTQGVTTYTVRDAITRITDCAVLVHLAWPNPSINKKEYDSAMEAEFLEVVDSIGRDKGASNLPIQTVPTVVGPSRKIRTEIKWESQKIGVLVFSACNEPKKENHDSQEDLPELKAAFDDANQLAAEKVKEWRGRIGGIQMFWEAKRQILKEKYHIDWKSPAELNPETRFD